MGEPHLAVNIIQKPWRRASALAFLDFPPPFFQRCNLIHYPMSPEHRNIRSKQVETDRLPLQYQMIRSNGPDKQWLAHETYRDSIS